MTAKFKYVCSRSHNGSGEKPGMEPRSFALYVARSASPCVTRRTQKDKALVWLTLVLPSIPRNYGTEEGDRPGVRGVELLLGLFG